MVISQLMVWEKGIADRERGYYEKCGNLKKKKKEGQHTALLMP